MGAPTRVTSTLGSNRSQFVKVEIVYEIVEGVVDMVDVI